MLAVTFYGRKRYDFDLQEAGRLLQMVVDFFINFCSDNITLLQFNVLIHSIS